MVMAGRSFGQTIAHCSQIHAACRNADELDMRQAAAVEARINLDLRIGAAFTRLTTMNIQSRVPELEGVISYGKFFPDYLVATSADARTMSVPNFRLRGGPVEEGTELRPRAILVYLRLY